MNSKTGILAPASLCLMELWSEFWWENWRVFSGSPTMTTQQHKDNCHVLHCWVAGSILGTFFWKFDSKIGFSFSLCTWQWERPLTAQQEKMNQIFVFPQKDRTIAVMITASVAASLRHCKLRCRFPRDVVLCSWKETSCIKDWNSPT